MQQCGRWILLSKDTFKVNQNDVEESSAALTSAASFLSFRPMSPTDDRSTITANANSKLAYNSSGALLASLGECIDAEAKAIKETGLKFKEYDDMIARYMEQGNRFQ